MALKATSLVGLDVAVVVVPALRSAFRVNRITPGFRAQGCGTPASCQLSAGSAGLGSARPGRRRRSPRSGAT